MKIFGSISFKIWIYFSSILFISSGLVIYYFPHQQEKAILKYRGKELQELCRTISLGVELSLDVNDFQKLKKSLSYYQKKRKDFDFLLLMQTDTLLGKESIFEQITDKSEFDFFKIDTSKYLMKSEPFSTPIMDGRVIIGLSKNRVSKEVHETNLPIYITLLVILLITILLFYFVARTISSPINQAIKNAKLLQDNHFESFNILPKNSGDEIAELHNALISLKDSLLYQKQDNKNLLDNLETKITERTDKLNQTLNRLNEAQEIASLGYYSFYDQKNALFCSENIKSILEIETGNINNLEHFKSLIDPEYIEEFEANFTKQPIVPFSIEIRTNVIDGTLDTKKWIAINGKCFTDKETGKCYLSGTIQEITARKNGEADLRRLSQAVKNSFNSIIITDLNQKITWINDSLLKLTGYSREEIIGNTPKMFQSEETDPETRKTIRENLKTFKSFKTEIQNKGKNGTSYWLELYIQPVLNEKGIAEGFMAIEIDITDRIEKEQLIKQYISEIEERQKEIKDINTNLEIKVAEKTKDLELSIEQIQKSQQELIKKEKLATLGLLVAGIAHEVNTPLGAIKASAENLDYLFSKDFFDVINKVSLTDFRQALEFYVSLKDLNSPDTISQRKYAKTIQEKLNLNYPQIPNAFALSKELAIIGFDDISNEATRLLQQENFNEIIRTVRLLLNIQRSLKTISDGALKSSKIIKALNVYSHSSDQTQQSIFKLKDNVDNIIALLWNKIKNNSSVKNNIPENIEISGFEDDLSQVWTNIINNALQASNNKCNIVFDYLEESTHHLITIKNDGPQIPEEVIGRVFDEFFTTKKRGEGTGLGLNIVKNIIEKHQGKINCTSSEKETLFLIRLNKLN